MKRYLWVLLTIAICVFSIQLYFNQADARMTTMIVGGQSVAGSGCSGSGDLGLTTIGGSSMSSGQSNVIKWTASGDICAEYIYIYGNFGGENIRLALYDDVAGEPTNVLASYTAAGAATSWQGGALSESVQISNGSTYWIYMMADGSSTYYYDTGSNGDRYRRADTYGDGTPEPYGIATATSSDRQITAYVSDSAR